MKSTARFILRIKDMRNLMNQKKGVKHEAFSFSSRMISKEGTNINASINVKNKLTHKKV